jgi:GH15 family glucan-1,4-alpha-glucosidase
MRTCALVATDGGLDFMCWPDFDSPSVFARMLDKDKGGHFTISPAGDALSTTKQHYLPSSNILQTRYLREDGVMNVVDFFPRPNNKTMDAEFHASVLRGKQRGEILTEGGDRKDLKKWLVRRVECMRGEVDVDLEMFPAFSEYSLAIIRVVIDANRVDYAQDEHTTEIVTLSNCEQGETHQRVVFKSKNLSLELNATIDCGDEPEVECPVLLFKKTPRKPHLGDGVTASFRLSEGQAVSFVLRDHKDHEPEHISTATVSEVQHSTQKYWARWISQSKYCGRWEDVVTRSLFILKLLTYEPTGAIVAAPTFSLPEDFGGE